MTSLMETTEAGRRVTHCPLCNLGESGFGQPKSVGDLISIFADEHMIVFLQPPTYVVAVAPTCHVTGLSCIEADSLGSFLAALRRTALHVQSVFGCSGTTIGPVENALPDADGHICFHVVPSIQGNGAYQIESGDPMIQAELLAKRFR
jgi:diadenosine tetraphosphate (Ap4A) HIT family hydrolase